MAINLVKPTAEALADPAQALLISLRFFEALRALQTAADAATPKSIADSVGKSQSVVLRGATVTLPGSTETFTADIYVTGIKV